MAYATPRVSTMSPTARTTCRVVGITLLAVGLALFVMAPISILAGMSAFLDGGSPFTPMVSFIAFGFGGVLCIGIGAFLTKLGFLRVASETVATETSGAVEHSAGAFGRGFVGGARSAGLNGMTMQQVIRVKCRSCGFLESEDAKFCSKCGKGL
jgi:hypothetical protein